MHENFISILAKFVEKATCNFFLRYMHNKVLYTHALFQNWPNRIRVSVFFAKSRDFGGGPETKEGLRINPLEIEFYSENIDFLLVIIFSSLKI